MYKRILLFSSLVVLFTSIGSAQNQGSGLGLGLQIGEPTGVSIKGWLSHKGALQLGVGWPSLSQDNGLAVSAEYLWHSYALCSRQWFPLFYGLGGIFGNDLIGARGIFGLAWWPRGSSLDIYLQLAPALYFKPSSKFDLDFGFGVRYFF
jgi:hypothetical protein